LWDSRVNLLYNVDLLSEKNLVSIQKWVFVLLIGACTAMIGTFIDFNVKHLSEFKFSFLYDQLDKENAGDAMKGSGFLFFALMQCTMVFIACCCVVFGEPMAAGSGIPEIKTMLNGVKVPNAVTLKALCCKVVGVLFSVAGGLPCGKEGPMIHSGSILGAGIPLGKHSGFQIDFSFKNFQVFRSDKHKRDFIACGAAAGVAAAFGAPIGGVLFALEEGVTHWHQGLTWKTFFCAMASSFVLNILLLSPGMLSGQLDIKDEVQKFGWLGNQHGTFGFGTFTYFEASYPGWMILIFALIGAAGGLSGALFNEMNTRLTKWRFKMAPLNDRWRPASLRFKLIEAVTVAFVVSSVAFGLSAAFGSCKPLPVIIAINNNGTTCQTGLQGTQARLYTLDHPPISDPNCARFYRQLLEIVAEYPVEVDKVCSS
jgi:H+/Cl- antiporter ClcA